jgi:hypothetical protein
MSGEALYVQYGCGGCAPEGWVNYDASLTLRYERLLLIGKLYTKNQHRFPRNVLYGDIVRGLPLRPGSCRGVYASHVLEHLALEDARVALKHTYSYLEPGGVFRLVVPDMEYLARKYVRDLDAGDRSALYELMKGCHLGRKASPRGIAKRLASVFGRSRHLWMWDFVSLAAELEEARFRSIRRCELGDSEDPRFIEVEDPSRFVGALAIECKKQAQYQRRR